MTIISFTRPQSIDLFDPERTQTGICQQRSCRTIFNFFMLSSTKCLWRKGFSSHIAFANWKTFLSNYHENIVVDFLTYGWPINYTACTRPVSSSRNHPSALNFDSHVQAYIDTELSYNAITGPFNYPPFADDFVCSPLQTVSK